MSQNIIYTTIPQAISSCASLEAQLALINTIVINMLTAINAAALSGTFEEYKLDTGQTRTEIRYRSLEELQKAYLTMSNTRQMILAELNNNKTGRITRLIDSKNFIGRNYPFNNLGN